MSSNRYFFDTSFLFAYLYAHDALAEKAQTLADEELQSGVMFVSQYVVSEMLTLSKVRAQQETTAAIRDFFYGSHIEICPHDHLIDAQVMETILEVKHRELSYVDLHMLYVMQRYGIDTLVTFDQALATAARERGLQVLS